ncbi:MAG TPA: hypothetical protein ENF26_06815 [Methanomicrobia archaeon]|nr:hypothetical protein [Methanomicrobia archaeon]HEX59838.1 hypothetical protein [Methanomicrobia archaeon]
MGRCVFSADGRCVLAAGGAVECDGKDTDCCPLWEIAAELEAATRALWEIVDAIREGGRR